MAQNQRLLLFSALFSELFSCCRSLLARCNEIKGLQAYTDRSAQHGRNTAVRFSFTNMKKLESRD
jgi:hypothetical protein